MRYPIVLILVLFLACVLQAAPAYSSDEPQPAEPATAEEREYIGKLIELLEKARAKSGEKSDEAVDWARRDLKRIGTWEYKIVVFSDDDDDALEEALNALGAERWEAFRIERTFDGRRIYCKRPARSYLRTVPGLMDMLPDGN